MKSDELAFFNQQLAVMLRDGIPLEKGMRELLAGMRQGPLKQELDLFQADLARGSSVAEALNKRQLPEFYRRMFTVGATAQDLPSMLTLLADYYHRTHATWAKVKGLMVYPVIVVVVAFLLSALLGFLFQRFLLIDTMGVMLPESRKALLVASLWISPAALAILAVLLILAVSTPSLRNWARWRVPAFREASLSQLGASMALMLRNGVPLPEALKLAEALEDGTPASALLAAWRKQIESGQGKAEAWQTTGKTLPRLFVWLVKSAGEDLASGFQKASELYAARSAYKTELLLYGVLPVSLLLLGQMVLWQMVPAMQFLAQLMNMLGSLD